MSDDQKLNELIDEVFKKHLNVDDLTKNLRLAIKVIASDYAIFRMKKLLKEETP